jgi:MinD-like ATPase involved in chromosome partitioning or flagellar assembly
VSAPPPRSRVTVALAAGTAGWEADALAAVAAAPTRVTLVKRCLDLNDLLVVAATGTVRVAVVDHGLGGLDSDSVERMRRAGVRTVAVLPHDASDIERQRLRRLGVARQVEAGGLSDLAATLEDVAASPLAPAGLSDLLEEASSAAVVLDEVEVGGEPEAAAPAGRVVAVWGPHGAPGRTTVAIGLAAEAAASGVATTLVDADPYGGAVGQHLAVLDEASGLLAAVRLVNAGQLDVARLATAARMLGARGLGDGLRLLTGLPRPDRWQEVRPHTLTGVLDVAAALTPLVVVDAGFGLDLRSLDGRPGAVSRDQLSMTTVGHADAVVVVASADPIGLTRLARSLLDLREVRPGGPDVVVVNRMRAGLGWAERDVVDMVARVAPEASVHFLPEDRAAADRALVGGRTLLEGPDGPLRRAMADLARQVLSGAVPDRGERRRRPGRRRVRRGSSRP